MQYVKATMNKSGGKVLAFIVILMAILLNQASIIFGINASIADLFCIAAIIILNFNFRLLLPARETAFFLIVSVVVLFTATYIVPLRFLYTPRLSSIVSDYAKLVAVFIYLIAGYNIARLNLMKRIVKWFSLTALTVGCIGIAVTFLNIKYLINVLFSDKIRFNGFMNDPNYFAVLQVAALSYFIRESGLKFYYKCAVTVLILASIILSGSKTGLITFTCFLAMLGIEQLILSGYKIKIYIVVILLIIIFIAAWPIISGIFQEVAGYLAFHIPAFSRIELLFSDFNGAISGGGSNRDSVWRTALTIIKSSPFVGVGTGVYSDLAEAISGNRAIAHNTYLQLLSEWGIPLTMIFYSYIFRMIVMARFKKSEHSAVNMTLVDIIIVLLVGSLAISLNNARIFWLLLGGIIYNIRFYNKSLVYEVRNSEAGFTSL